MTAGWLKVTSAAKYMDLSPKSVRRLIKTGLPVCRLPSGTILIQRIVIDEYLEQFQTNKNEIETVVNQIMADLDLR